MPAIDFGFGLGKVTRVGMLAVATLLAVGEGTAQAEPTYLRANVGAPWGSTSNEEAMDLVFGVGGWVDERFETVDVGVLFSGATGFIYMDGSDSGALELNDFLLANQAELEAWVTGGGTLILNSAPNEGGDMDWGFGGVLLSNGVFGDTGTASDPAHPIWAGPFLPASTDFSGNSFSHAAVSGPGLVPLLESLTGSVAAAELNFGNGVVIFGGLTTSNFWDPQPDGLHIRANMIAYLSSGDSDEDGISDITDNCPEIPNPDQDDADGDFIGDICDVCPTDPLNDADEDMACDTTDNCLELANPMQLDDDMDGLGNACDECPGDPDDDIDNDTVCGDIDNCPEIVNVNQADEDEDGIGDLCDVCEDDPGNDDDMDGVCAADDNCPDDANEDQADADGDGIGDVCDDTPGGGSSGGADGTTGGDESTGDGDGPTDSGDGPPPGTGDDAPPPADGSGTDGGSTSGPSADGGDDTGGCSCRTDGSRDGWWWLFGLPALLLRRRRS